MAGITDEIKAGCNIVDVIGRSVNLKRSGSNYKGVCPFHNEKTPSFVVSEDKQIFTCFGCGQSGDVISFVEKYYNLSFQEAIEKLASEYNIELKSGEFKNEKKKDVMYNINAEAARFFFEQMRTTENPAYKYIRRRGISDQTIVKFGIGYAPDSWDSLILDMKDKGIDEKQMTALGLASGNNGKIYSKFRNRIMFPIINTRGKVIGFGGRVLDDGIPKYLNSPESEIFRKKNNLFGINLTRQEISKEGKAILVEGYMDGISLFQQCVKNVVASLGTALTENQALMLKRYTNDIVIAYDADEAGINAAVRAIDILIPLGLKVRVLKIDDGKDPDEYIKKHGKNDFMKAISKAVSATAFKLDILKEKFDIKSNDGRIDFLNEASRELKKISPIEAEMEIKKLVKDTGVSEGALRLQVLNEARETRKAADNVFKNNSNQESVAAAKHKFSQYEGYFIKLMVTKCDFIDKVKIYDFVFKNPSPINIYQIILRLYDESGEDIDTVKLKDSLESDDLAVFENITENIKISDKENLIFEECVRGIEGRKSKNRQQDIIKILSVLDEEKDKEEIDKLTRELIEIQRTAY